MKENLRTWLHVIQSTCCMPIFIFIWMFNSLELANLVMSELTRKTRNWIYKDNWGDLLVTFYTRMYIEYKNKNK